MVGANLKDAQLQQIVDKTIINADTDGDGKISFEEFCMVPYCYLLIAVYEKFLQTPSFCMCLKMFSVALSVRD